MLVEIFKLGKYSLEERRRKILRFKMRKIITRIKKPLLKNFIGRSFVAKKKLRYKGKFIKQKDKLFKLIKN